MNAALSVPPSILHLLIASMGALSGCAPGDSSERGPAHVFDSAGARVAKYAAIDRLDLPHYALGDVPMVTIGGTRDAEPGHAFSGVVGAFRLSGGRIAVADGGSREIRIFDAGGMLLRVVGGVGGGPGEFNRIRWLGRAGDGMVVWDPMLSRVTALDDNGDLARTVTLPAQPLSTTRRPIGALGDSVLIFEQATDLMAFADTVEGHRRDPVTYLAYRLADAREDTLLRVPGPEYFLARYQSRTLRRQPVIFGRSSYAVTLGDVFVVGTSDDFEIRLYDQQARLLQLVRMEHAPVQVSDTDIEMARAALQRSVDEELATLPQGLISYGGPAVPIAEAFRPSMRYGVEAVRARRELPAFASLVAGADGTLWVQLFARPSSRLATWLVLDRQARPAQVVRIPTAGRLMAVALDWVLMLERDSLDVEAVSLYGLDHP